MGGDLLNIDELVRIAVEAGRAILEVKSRGTAVARKEDGSPVTVADRAAHDVIVRGLLDFEEKRPVVSEEGDIQRMFARAEAVRSYWLVDPLDGTKEYIAGRPEYTVNIALIESGVPVAGVVYIPESGRIYRAVRGGGAFCSDASGGPDPMGPGEGDGFSHSWRRLPLDSLLEARGSSGAIGVMSRSHGSAHTRELFRNLGIHRILRRGSSLKICAVAEGSADFYPRLGPTWFWDTAAGVAVAREAGCRVTDLAGRDLDYHPGGAWKHEGFLVSRQTEWISAACRILAGGKSR